jgi:hypothetical protein
MQIIRATPNPSGGYPPIQNTTSAPEGCLPIADGVDTSAFYEAMGFVDLTVADGVVTSMTANTTALEAYRASLPESAAPVETVDPDADRDAMLVDLDYRTTLLELGVNE